MEILDNSIIKLIVRQGVDTDRQATTLESGELGYTTDYGRLFVGDGVTPGGGICGNIFKGVAPSVTNSPVSPAIVGDFGFGSNDKKLRVLTQNDGTSINDWTIVGGEYTSGDDRIQISSDNKITMVTLSAGSIGSDATEDPIYINPSGKISIHPLGPYGVSSTALKSPLGLDSGMISLSPLSANHISNDLLMPTLTLIDGRIGVASLSANSITNDALSSPLYINNGKITLGDIPPQLVSTKTLAAGDGLTSEVLLVDYGSTPLSPLTNSITIKSTQKLLRYPALSASEYTYSRNIQEYSKLAVGHYSVSFQPIPIYFPIVQILGQNALDCQARVTSMTISSCEIKVMTSTGTLKDANICLTINY
jgi:hypothetical protein